MAHHSPLVAHFHGKSMKREYIIPFLFAFFCMCVLIGTILPAFLPMAYMFLNVGRDIISGNILFILVVFYWSAIVLVFYSLRHHTLTRIQTLLIIAFLVGVSVVARLYYVLNFDQAYFSDFRAYWSIAADMVENGLKPATNVYIQRALAFNYPLIYVFGDADIVFKTANVILLTLTGLMASFIAARWISHHAAVAIYIIVSCFPETYYASLIPSHDITGSFYLMMCFLIAFLSLEQTQRQRYAMVSILVLMLSVMLVLLEMQRGLLKIFLASLGFALLLYNGFLLKCTHGLRDFIHRAMLPFVLLIIIPYIFYMASFMVLKNKLLCDLSLGQQVYRWNTLNDGTFRSQVINLRNDYVFKLPNNLQQRADFQKSLFWSDLYYEPLERPANYFLRATQLYNLGSQLGFYIGRLSNVSPHRQIAITNQARVINRHFHSAFLLMLVLTSGYAVFYAERFNLVAATALIFMSASSFALVTIGENQPRYLFMGYFLWPICICAVLHTLFSNQLSPSQWHIIAKARFGKITLVAIIMVMAVTAFTYAAFSWKFKGSSLRMLDLEIFQSISCDQSVPENICSRGLIEFEKTVTNRKWAMLQLQLPDLTKDGQFIKTEHTFKVKAKHRYALELFVQQPYQREDGQTGFFDIVIRANQQYRKLHLENTDAQQYVRLENIIPYEGKITVSFEIRCVRCWPRISWQRASLTNFRFARLYPMK